MVAFSLDLPTGSSALRVRYRARACGAAERPTVTWQLPYVLAPAREWGAFGRLDVTVHLPDSWDARSTPALEREGDTLRGSFTELPADALLLATGAPVPREYSWAVWLSEALWGLVLLGGPVMCWLAGRRLARARATSKALGGGKIIRVAFREFVLGVFPALLWGACIFALVPMSMGIIKPTLHGQESPEFGEPWLWGTCLICVLIPAAVLLGVIVTQWRASRAPKTTPPC